MATLTTTHAAPHALHTQLMSLADDFAATLLINDAAPPNPDGTNPYGEHQPGHAQPTAVWFVDDFHAPALMAALHALGVGPAPYTTLPDDVDYVAQTAANFPPLYVTGDYLILRNNETVEQAMPLLPDWARAAVGRAQGRLIPLHIPANMAFGSGEHPTTGTCLTAYYHLIHASDMEPGEPDAQFAHGLDFGSGSALLAIAAAKTQGTRMLAVDNDPAATRIGHENAERNGVGSLVTTLTADTPAHPAVMAHAPYPLVFANILMGPLVRLAQPLANVVAPGGFLILSGFTAEQLPDIMDAYTGIGLVPTARTERDGWQTLTFTKPH